MALKSQPDYRGIIGPVGQVVDLNGVEQPMVIPGAALVDPTTGNAIGTAANPVVVSTGSGGGSDMAVHGPDATGAAPTKDPVFVAGVDGSGNVEPLHTDDDGNLRVVSPSATWTDHSGTITAGATSQQLMPANPARRGFFVQNLSAEDLFIMDGAAATAGQPSMKIPPDGLYESPANGAPATAINIIGATTGSAFSAREF